MPLSESDMWCVKRFNVYIRFSSYLSSITLFSELFGLVWSESWPNILISSVKHANLHLTHWQQASRDSTSLSVMPIVHAPIYNEQARQFHHKRPQAWLMLSAVNTNENEDSGRKRQNDKWRRQFPHDAITEPAGWLVTPRGMSQIQSDRHAIYMYGGTGRANNHTSKLGERREQE